MSLFPSDEPTNNDPGPETFVAHCNGCGAEYYVNVTPGNTVDSTLKDMHCSCDNSQMVQKGTNDGVVSVEHKDNVTTD